MRQPRLGVRVRERWRRRRAWPFDRWSCIRSRCRGRLIHALGASNRPARPPDPRSPGVASTGCSSVRVRFSPPSIARGRSSVRGRADRPPRPVQPPCVSFSRSPARFTPSDCLRRVQAVPVASPARSRRSRRGRRRGRGRQGSAGRVTNRPDRRPLAATSGVAPYRLRRERHDAVLRCAGACGNGVPTRQLAKRAPRRTAVPQRPEGAGDLSSAASARSAQPQGGGRRAA